MSFGVFLLGVDVGFRCSGVDVSALQEEILTGRINFVDFFNGTNIVHLLTSQKGNDNNSLTKWAKTRAKLRSSDDYFLTPVKRNLDGLFALIYLLCHFL